jgi:hypothetical protein
LPKWSPRCQLDIHLVPLNEHAQNVCLVLNPNTGLVSPQHHCRFDNFFESVRLQGPELTVPTTWQRLSKLTQDNPSTLWEQKEGTAAKFSNISGLDAPQEEADIFNSTSNHFEQNEHDQAPPHPIQDDTMDDEPIARQTRGRLQHQQFVQRGNKR